MTKRKVVAVWGTFEDKGDFVLEPVCSDTCECKECKNAFWIENVEESKE